MILLPQAITKYLTTNLDQPYTEWNASNNYANGARVFYKNYVYQCITDNNQNVQPDLNTGKWLLIGVDNAYAGIDLQSSTQTVIDDELTQIDLEFSAVGFQYLAFGGTLGGVLTITEYDSGNNEIEQQTYNIGGARVNANNWYDYYFAGIPETGASDFPVDILVDKIQTTTAKIKVELDRTAKGEAFISSMVSGKGYAIGDTEYGVKMSLIDYSSKQTDVNGITTLERRRSREVMECDIVASASDSQYNKIKVKEVLGTALMFIADPTTDSKFLNLIILGYVDSYETYLNDNVIARSRIRIEEVL